MEEGIGAWCAPTESPRPDRCRAEGADPGYSCPLARHVWGTAHPRRAGRDRHAGEPQASRPADAPGGLARRQAGRRPAPDLVQRAFTAAGPNQLWVADITYIATWSGFLYLAVVLDAWSRRIVGWAMETHLCTALVLAALDMAVKQR